MKVCGFNKEASRKRRKTLPEASYRHRPETLAHDFLYQVKG
jgi:hypothetical protein